MNLGSFSWLWARLSHKCYNSSWARGSKSWMRDVVLLVDAMALHKMTIYDKAKNSFVGMVDYGTAIPESETNEATEVLVFMIIGLTGNWKVFRCQNEYLCKKVQWNGCPQEHTIYQAPIWQEQSSSVICKIFQWHAVHIFIVIGCK